MFQEFKLGIHGRSFKSIEVVKNVFGIICLNLTLTCKLENNWSFFYRASHLYSISQKLRAVPVTFSVLMCPFCSELTSVICVSLEL